jgi:hypothetical protein
LPCFCLLPPEDSLFLPCCGHRQGLFSTLDSGYRGDLEMTIKASAALIFAAGLLMGIAGPLPATAAEGDTQQADIVKGTSAAISEKADTVPQTTTDKPAEVDAPAEPAAIAADQSSSFDRSLTPSEQPATATSQGVVLASTSRPSSEQASNDSSTLDKTSMIGKIFIAVGALLTVASAARMFIA